MEAQRVWVTRGCRKLGKGGGQEDETVRESLVQMVARVQRGSCVYDFPPSPSPSLGTDVSILQVSIV